MVVAGSIMAVAGMAAADYNTVGTALKCAEDKHGIDSARAGNADYLYIRGVVQTIVAGKIGARIGAPVAAEGNNKRFVFVYLHIASTSAEICLFRKPLRSIAPDIQATVQAPQPWQTASLTEATRLIFVVLSGILNSFSIYVIAP